MVASSSGDKPRVVREPAPDPLIEEVRELKRAASRACGDDLKRLAERLRQIEETHAARVRRRSDEDRSGRVA